MINGSSKQDIQIIQSLRDLDTPNDAVSIPIQSQFSENVGQFNETIGEGADPTTVDPLINPLGKINRLFKLDIKNAGASDTLVFNATMSQEPNVGQIYCNEYQGVASSIPLEGFS